MSEEEFRNPRWLLVEKHMVIDGDTLLTLEGWMVVLLVAVLVFQLVAFIRSLLSSRSLLDAMQYQRDLADRSERALRDELSEARRELSEMQRAQGDAVASQLRTGADSQRDSLKTLAESVELVRQSVPRMVNELGMSQKVSQDLLLTQFRTFTESVESKFEFLRGVVDKNLEQLRLDHTRHSEELRVIVSEKLQSTLEARLGESFKLVGDRLEQVHRGLGEMQGLATGVSDLKRIMSNVKTRGSWGEVQLDLLLQQVLAPSQYARNVAVKPGSGEFVEFAIRIPLPDDDGAGEIYLPMDSKFPVEDYQRLLEAADRGDLAGVEEAGKLLETRVKASAKMIATKYINPPLTTDFAIMFLPTEGIYAEVVKRPGLLDELQNSYRVMICGPSTCSALLSSLQLGLKTLALQRRSHEVWKLLSAVKTEFSKFGDLLDGVRKKLEQATTNMEGVSKRSRTIEKKLQGLEILPDVEVEEILGLPE